MEVRLNGKLGMAAAAVVVLIVALRIASLGESRDPGLRAAVRAELANRLGARTGRDLAALREHGDLDAEAARGLVERADTDGIRVQSTAVSRPILSLAGSEDVIVRVEYALPGAGSRREYWRFEHSAIAGWRYRRPSTAISYYLNFW